VTNYPVLGHEASGPLFQIGKNIKGDFKGWASCRHELPAGLRPAVITVSNGMEHFCERIAGLLRTRAEYTVFQYEGMVFPLPDDLPWSLWRITGAAGDRRTHDRYLRK